MRPTWVLLLFSLLSPLAAAQNAAPEEGNPLLAPEFVARLDRETSSRLVGGNGFELLTDAKASLARKRELVEAAKNRVYLSTLILFGHADRETRELVDALLAKARAGVRVHVVIDGLGSLLDPLTPARLERAGARIAYFNSPTRDDDDIPLAVRSHEKFLVIDDRAAVIGGANTVNEEFPFLPVSGFEWKDTDLYVEGPAAAEIARRFVAAWNAIPGPIALEAPPAPEAAPTPPGDAGACRLLVNEPFRGEKHINAAYKMLLARASRRVVWQGNWLDPSPDMAEALEGAAARGVEVILLTNSGRLSSYLSGPYHEYLLRRNRRLFEGSGVQVREYTGGFDHSKVFLVDGTVASIGSYNHDWMSMENDSESTLLVHDSDLVKEVEARAEEAIRASRPFLSKGK
ncbi:MAG: phosphatidylserine/phosphatidylglycerophosphate/cardiolipin synthase family protein [Planctomycetes bacterium]|nr:phosphatidylserine/phosphatidylglycerophosphate/cardiolipin synthase family protein [Planctomycetota bacterium]